jgi:hypothetical protein
LAHLEKDKHTLAQCIQVSPIFNSIAASLLYRNITIDANTKLPFASFPTSPANLRRLAPDKMANLKCVDQVTFQEGVGWCDHYVKDIPATFILNVSMLVVYRLCEPDRRLFDYQRGRCQCTTYLRPRKIVYRDTLSQHVRYIRPDMPQVATVATRFRDAAPTVGPGDYKLHVATLCHFGGRFTSQLLFVFPTYSSPGSDVALYYASIWSFLRPLLFKAAPVDKSPDFVIVNIESLLAASVSEAERDVKSDAEVAAAATEKAYSLHLEKERSRREQSETWGKPRSSQFKFVSIQTYLEEYDWKGVFTDREVQLYLRDRDKKQSGSE